MIKNILKATALFMVIQGCQSSSEKSNETTDTLAYVEPILNIELTQAERDSLKDGLKRNLNSIKTIHGVEIENSTAPALVFDPRPQQFQTPSGPDKINWNLPSNVTLPDNREDLAFYTVEQLSALVKARKITSEELTKYFIERLKKYGDTLQSVITITEERALEQARKADREIASGNYRGPLHGIPYGAKDLLAVEGYKTTWGAMPFKDQEVVGTATVIKKLDEAGAVLVAKLTLGALAMGDIWYGGKTKNPWNMEQGSSGSSAGSASATAAGLVPFAIGTETWGSIVSPSTRCGVTGLRPTFGRVSKHGAMALSWSMDKIGPIARSARDCAIVFEAIRGTDGKDLSVVDAPFHYNAAQDVKSMKVGYVKELFERDYGNRTNDSLTLKQFESMGLKLHEVQLPEDIPTSALSIILASEASAAFDLLTRSNQDSLLVNQKKNAWPNYFRTSRFISAVDYINANRIRSLLIEKLNDTLKDYDAVLVPSFGGDQLLMTNLTGNPCVVFPNGFNEEGSPTSFSIIGNLYEEGKLLELAAAYQQATEHDEAHPEYFSR